MVALLSGCMSEDPRDWGASPEANADASDSGDIDDSSFSCAARPGIDPDPPPHLGAGQQRATSIRFY